MSTRIEPVSQAAAVPMAVLHRACFPEDPWDAAAMDRILGLSGGFALTAWQEEEPVGFIIARDLGDELEILSLGVLAEWRRHGIGRALLDGAAAEGTRRGIGTIVLEVAAENAPARRLYAAAGYIQVGRRPHYYRRAGGAADALILRRTATGEPRPR